jgi:ATP-dependent RNA helicase SUPV3L1/SUV3
MTESSEQKKLKDFLDKWILEKINNELKSLMDLKYLKQENPHIRALSFHLYENNGVVKRENVSDFLKKLSQDDRKILRDLGVKFGRYHIFLFKMFKPNIVSFRILLWKNYNQINLKFKPPTFGLNFLENKNIKDKNLMLLSGFEKFDKFFVRIDILERLFIKLYNFQSKDKEIKLIPEMLNLLGCSKDNFINLIKLMNYKSFEKENDTYIKYIPRKMKKLKKFKNIRTDNPFEVLNKISFK